YSMVTNAPATPNAVLGTGIDGTQLNISWNSVATNTATFDLERKQGTNGTYALLVRNDGDTPNYLDTSSPSTNVYFYRVKAFNYFGETAYSDAMAPPTVSLTAPTNSAALPSGLTNSLTVSLADADGTV